MGTRGKAGLSVAAVALVLASVAMAGGLDQFEQGDDVFIGNFPVSIAAADFDRDGKRDLVAANEFGNADERIGVALGEGDGTFEAALLSPGPQDAFALAVGDFDKNGKKDIVVGTFGGESVAIMRGKGNGEFKPLQEQPIGGAIRDVAVGDFNGDGKPDVAAADDDESSVVVLRGKGDGTLGHRDDYDLPSSPFSLAVTDLNRDGRKDIAALTGGNSVSILIGKAKGKFKNQGAENAGVSAGAIAAAKLEGDKSPDLVAADGSSNDLAVLHGNGKGHLEPPDIYDGESAQSGQIAVADLDGDDRKDIAVVGVSPGEAAIVYGKKNGTFSQPSQVFPAVNRGGAVVAAKLDGNKRVDLAASDANNDIIAIFLNNP
jgi:hypothetical protein